MQRYFIKENYHTSDPESLKLIGDDFHHAAHVMRMKVGQECFLVFQDEVAVRAKVTELLEDYLLLEEVAKEEQEKELPLNVTIACGYTKGDKLDLVVQKGTEMGAYQFLGFPGQTSVVKWDHKKLKKKQERLAKIAKEAAEQSHRHLQPEVILYETEQYLRDTFQEYDVVLVAYEESAKQGEKGQLVKTLQQLPKGGRLLVLFGPEGGFSPQEIATFTEMGALTCGLGPRILRAETAPLYLLGAISYQLELL
ncbi:16S rRNA (uracil(1498)-N(3))-methyltransferase [Vagococcus intermedius]|uniref:Ribosomal RNA small subunit methyltransferase E n=1 Tax=Vagococcus intermedius TaxID=2991418 RepID=A0AAF0I7A5_9ENTE|nr:16S rRNA (uracil(1498)-N(3))-methyltransferase [Vagococcus intermedius]WEG73215.1 16S rRNA (uracil(1498)-N(3))-methyltransferase [Vagococcus intermedius]WEG75300.1 16S rRNA (uracil(1498)-N(3))-methyltransferase [Vagococcus intermedius]